MEILPFVTDDVKFMTTAWTWVCLLLLVIMFRKSRVYWFALGAASWSLWYWIIDSL